jgi:hypothetical protein
MTERQRVAHRDKACDGPTGKTIPEDASGMSLQLGDSEVKLEAVEFMKPRVPVERR